jgi:uncharacterized protein YcfJ
MHKMIRLISACLVLAAFAFQAGCTTTGTTDAQRTRNEGTAVGAGTGALLGGIVGALVGGDSKGTLLGAAIGAAAGGAAGYAYGDHVASKKAEYTKQEDWLDQCIASAQQVNQETRAYNEQLKTQIAQLDAKTRELEQQYAASQADKQTLLAEKKKIDAAIKTTDEKLNRAKFEMDAQKQALAQVDDKGVQAQNLDAEIVKLKDLIQELEQHGEDLAGLSSRMAV